MRIILVFCLTFSIVFGAEIPCKYEFNGAYSCNLKLANILVTSENEPICVTGTHIATHNAGEVQQLYFASPHVLKFVPTKVFETFKNLNYFGMYQVGLTTMTTNAFKNCLKLENIYSNNNQFPTLPASFAASCVNVKMIQFFGSSVQTIHKDAFKGLANLNLLQITQHELTVLDPSTFVHTPSLSTLDLQMGKLTSIPAELFATLSLTVISITNNKITSLPAMKFKNISGLKHFNLDFNKIAEIDPNLLKNYPADRIEFNIYLNGNVCTTIWFSNKTQISKLQPCFDSWIKSHPVPTTRRCN
jgi:hypothetical protein